MQERMTNCPKDFISKFLLSRYSCPYISVRERIFLTVNSVLKKRGKQSTVRKFWSPSSFVGLENPLRILNINSLLYKTNRFQVAEHFFVLTTFWRHLRSITEQTHGNLESIC